MCKQGLQIALRQTVLGLQTDSPVLVLVGGSHPVYGGSPPGTRQNSPAINLIQCCAQHTDGTLLDTCTPAQESGMARHA